MNCPDCKGEGELTIDSRKRRCFLCNGGGQLCDVCGDPTNEPGQDVCDKCREDKEAE